MSPWNELFQASYKFRFSSSLAFIARSTLASRGPKDRCVLVYRCTKERNINELCHNSMYGYENNRNSPVYRYTRTAPKRCCSKWLRYGLLLLRRTNLDCPGDLTIGIDVESNPGDITPNSEESLRRNQTCIISSAGDYANFQNAESIVYSFQYLFSLKSCTSVLSWDVKNRLSDLGIARRKRRFRAGKQIRERHCNLRPISSRITSRSIENDNK